MTTPEPPLSAPPASSQALPADHAHPAVLPPIETLCAARQWATEHRHQQPDDRMLAIVYAAGEERGWHRGFDHARRYPAPTAAASPAPTGTRDPAVRWWTHGSCGPAPGNADGPRWTSCVGCGKPDLQWQPYDPTPGNPANGDDTDG